MGLEPLKLNSRYREMAEKYKCDPPSEPPDYEKEIPFGRKVNTGEIVSISIAEDDRIGIFGDSGSGKTTLAKTIMSRYWLGGAKIVHMTDIKHDFADIDNRLGTDNEGVSKKLIRDSEGLVEGEEPYSVPKEMFMPKALYDAYPEYKNPPYFVTPFTLSFDQVSTDDFKSMLNLSDSQEASLNNILDNIPSDQLSLNAILEQVDMIDGSKQMVNSLRQSLNSIKSENVISERFYKDPLEPLEDSDTVISIGLENWDEFRYSGSEKIEMFLTVILRELRKKIRQRDISTPVVVFIDEAHSFLPSGRKSLFKQPVADLLNVWARANGMIPILSSQAPSQLPNPDDRRDMQDLVGKLNHLLLAPNLAEKDWKSVLKSTNLYSQHNLDKWRKRFRRMNQYQFLYINGKNDNWCIVNPFAPLWPHTG